MALQVAIATTIGMLPDRALAAGCFLPSWHLVQSQSPAPRRRRGLPWDPGSVTLFASCALGAAAYRLAKCSRRNYQYNHALIPDETALTDRRIADSQRAYQRSA